MSGVERVLVIAAHPDDETLGCGGTMALLADAGAEVSVLILGEGVSSRYVEGEKSPAFEIERLWSDSRKAVGILGAREPLFAGLPDNRFDTVPLLDIVRVIERHVADLKPHRVFTQSGGDLNIDHSLTFRATMTALRPGAFPSVEAVLAYEAPSSTEWSCGKISPVFSPNVYYDISGTLDRKLEAMSVYESEDRPFPHPRSRQALTALAQVRGVASGLEAAEAFELVRQVRG